MRFPTSSHHLQGLSPEGILLMIQLHTYTAIAITRESGYAVIQLNRPDVLNAINSTLMEELVDALEYLDKESDVRCMILTGNERAFAAGADIKEIAEASAIEMLLRDQFARWDRIRKIKKPLIAAVSGYALGGGWELALACDVVIASETAVFGQPEVNIGVMPGAGATQRLTRIAGKHRAMELILTGRTITAGEAKEWGFVNRVVPAERYLEEARAVARELAGKPPVALRLAKEAILKALDSTMEEGLDFERRNFYLLFASEDQKEGMMAFIGKRRAEWKGR
jgi:enoyl-CoA hydratase